MYFNFNIIIYKFSKSRYLFNIRLKYLAYVYIDFKIQDVPLCWSPAIVFIFNSLVKNLEFSLFQLLPALRHICFKKCDQYLTQKIKCISACKITKQNISVV